MSTKYNIMSTCLVNDVFINISSHLKIIGRLVFFFGKNFSVDLMICKKSEVIVKSMSYLHHQNSKGFLNFPSNFDNKTHFSEAFNTDAVI